MFSRFFVVMMYKVTIFERYTQHLHFSTFNYWRCYDVQSYNFWKIYTTHATLSANKGWLLWCTKLQFLKDIHNVNNKKERKRLFFLHIYKKIYTFAVQFWKIYTIRIIPLCKHSEWHASVALFLYYPTRYIPSARAFGNMVAKTDALHHWATCSSAFPHNKQTKSWFVMETPHSPPNKANSPRIVAFGNIVAKKNESKNALFELKSCIIQ